MLLLRDVFDHGYAEIAEIAEIAGKSQDNVRQLAALLAHDVVLRGDGGGKVPALARACTGATACRARWWRWGRQGARIPGATLLLAHVNGQPGALALGPAERVIGVMALDVADGQIQAIASIVNPDKRAHLGAVLDLRALLAQRER